MRVNDVEGTAMLSKKRLDAVKNWAAIEEAQESGEIVEGKVTEDNKGGIVVSVKGIRPEGAPRACREDLERDRGRQALSRCCQVPDVLRRVR